ncbi:reverse transcriptase [Gossypium australe]|uniref:Reverse transcriptase n=1 Tax=Gossypium australe TaxID=47621 RepID=A0A5B6URR3_9ROSI|nr:reverse transcriptase [Gossypium australe]
MTQVELEVVHKITGFALVCLPVRYFGIQLVARKFTVKDCAPLLGKVEVNGWVAKNLSYACRSQLVQAILFHIQNYRTRHFLLPKVVIKLVNQMCMRLLRKGQNEKVKAARVSWGQIRKPKNGGFGLKDLANWNKACEAILIQAGSLWIAWINAYMLREDMLCNCLQFRIVIWVGRNRWD